MSKKFLSVLLLIAVTFSSSDNATCFAANNGIFSDNAKCFATNNEIFSDNAKCFATNNGTFYNNCTRVVEKIKIYEAALNKLKAENANLRMSVYILYGCAAILLGIILGKPLWRCLYLTAWELDTWGNKLTADKNLKGKLDSMKAEIDFLNTRVNGVARKLHLPEIQWSDIATQTL